MKPRASTILLAAATLAGCSSSASPPPRAPLPLSQVAQVRLPGDSSRFDYASLDAQRGLLFIAHLGASQVVEVDLTTRAVVRVVHGIADVHGVLAVPELGRVYATATAQDQVVALDETTGHIVGRASTGAFPDGLAYDSRDSTIWTTNEADGSETVVDATTLRPIGTVKLGDSVGNNAYNESSADILVDVQSDNALAEIDPRQLKVIRRLHLPGCTHDHGLTLDNVDQLAFVACDGNAILLTIDLTRWTVIDRAQVGVDPDVLAYDPGDHRLFVAAESGWVTVLHLSGDRLMVEGRDHLADGAHVVAIDPSDHYAYFPIPSGRDGHAALLVERSTR